MVATPEPYLTPAEYLEREERSSLKHEYVNGRIYAMSGASLAHNTIAGNLFAALRPHLRGCGCRVFISDVKVSIESRNCFYYPDLVITCDERDREASKYLCFPRLVVEVLSDSTEAFDRGDKFEDYQQLKSLQEYVLISSKRPLVQCYRRTPERPWLFETFAGKQSDFHFESIRFSMSLADLYEEVIFPG
jgi:Uma2 family endonuclease